MLNSPYLNFIVVIISLAVGFIVLELAYRGFLAIRYPGVEAVVPREIGQFDPLLGWALKPGSHAVSHRIGEIEYRINSKGLRDDEHEYEKAAGKKRIVIIGDSRTFGYGVRIEKHFTRLLEGYCTETEVINFGVPGYGVDQELLALKAEGFKYDPDLVIAYVAHYGNHRHMHTTRWGKNKPKFELRDSLVLTNQPVEKPEKRASNKSIIFSSW